MTPQAYLYICDGDIDHPVLTHKKMDWPDKYPHWQEIPLVMAQRQWVELTDDEIKAIAKPHDDIEIPMTGRMWVFVADLMDKLKEKNHA